MILAGELLPVVRPFFCSPWLTGFEELFVGTSKSKPEKKGGSGYLLELQHVLGDFARVQYSRRIASDEPRDATLSWLPSHF